MVQRNDPCPCGSGKKYKKCCLERQAAAPEVNALWESALAQHRAGRLLDAERLYREVLVHQAAHGPALHRLSVLAYQRGQAASAIDLLTRATAAYADHPVAAQRDEHAEACNNLGTLYLSQSEAAAAEAPLQHAIRLRPAYAEAHFNLGICLLRQAKWDEARRHLQQAVEIKPEYAEAHDSLGTVHARSDRLGEAKACFEQAIRLNPSYAPAYYNLATALMTHGHEVSAALNFKKALALEPGYGDALYNLGTLYLNANAADEALSCFTRALQLQPDFTLAQVNLGNALLNLGRGEEAVAYLGRVVERQPASTAAYDAWLQALNYLSDIAPIALLEAHRRYAAQFETPLRPHWPLHDSGRDPARRLRIGYVSADLRLHSVALFMEPILAHHDKREVEVYCYYNHVHQDAVTMRLKAHADHWIPCKDLNDAALAARIEADGIDILVDLSGHTAGNRLPVFARKPAPVQLSYLGYVATTGLSAMDYRLTNVDADPPGNEAYNSERLYRMPRALWCFRPAADSPAPDPVPPAARNGYVTFASLNNFAKLTPAMLATWADLLRAVPGARLRLVGVPQGTARRRLYERFAAQGVGAERLAVEGKVSTALFRLLHREIDIALDPYPHNGNTTTCESLWMGVPVISLTGSSFVSRFGNALLKTVGLSELAAEDEAAYVATAAALARDPDRLGTLRATLRERMAASALRDEAGFTRELEDAYRTMWRAGYAA
jgi:predicted O-linked N-acetylglucosamine transferase (SPINDLY family)